MKKDFLRFTVVMLCSFVWAGPAIANTQFFAPISGAAFNPVGSQGNNSLVLTQGVLYSVETAFGLTASASLGHTTGGTNAWTAQLLGNAADGDGRSTWSCTIIAQLDGPYNGPNGLTSYVFSGTLVVPARFVLPLTINTSVPAGSYSYSIQCTIPKYLGNGAGIIGVTPNH